MPHFEFDFNEDGSIHAIYKDDKPYESGITLEMPNAIVQTYFASALRNLAKMKLSDDPNEDAGPDNRHYGLQSFLMSLVGTEAFINIYFHLAGLEKALPDVVDLATKDRPIEHKLAHLPRLTFGTPLPASKKLCAKIRELYNLRSNIVHPKWTPSSLSMQGMMIAGLVDNQQKLFEDREYCREALRWCLLVVARIGVHSGAAEHSQFVNYWTKIADTNETISAALGIPPDGI